MYVETWRGDQVPATNLHRDWNLVRVCRCIPSHFCIRCTFV